MDLHKRGKFCERQASVTRYRQRRSATELPRARTGSASLLQNALSWCSRGSMRISRSGNTIALLRTSAIYQSQPPPPSGRWRNATQVPIIPMMASQPWLPFLVIFRSGPLVIRPLLAHQGNASKMQRESTKNYKKIQKTEEENFFLLPSHESRDPSCILFGAQRTSIKIVLLECT